MMEEQNHWIEQLKIMQSNIQSLFEGVIKEKNDYKEGNNFLSASLKQMIGRIDNLERQNDMLRRCNTSMRNIFSVGLKTFRKLDLSCVNSIRDNRVSLEMLQKLFLESSEKMEIKIVANEKMQLSAGAKEKNEEAKTTKSEVNDDRVKEKNFGFENSNAPKQVRSEIKGGEQLELNSSQDILRNIAGKKPQNANDVKRKLIHQVEASSVERADVTICKPPEPPPQINGSVIGSPVFKDARKQDPSRTEESKGSKSPPLILINEKFVEKSAQLLISPWKHQQTDGSSTSKGQFTPKRASKSESKFSSPGRSPSSTLRRSISRDVDAGSSGGKKLMQTFLNIDCFKQKSPVGGKNSRSNLGDENTSKRTRLANAEDDDLIFESPKRGNPFLEVKMEDGKRENDSRCLDETFISSPAIRQFNSGHNQMVEDVKRNQTTQNRPREKSPEYDSVPFVYKREAVRKKEDRMKLPGHPCFECDKYYKNALADIDTNDFAKILNKCSRHRDKNPPALDETPPGYWKPYLTCTNVLSPDKHDTR